MQTQEVIDRIYNDAMNYYRVENPDCKPVRRKFIGTYLNEVVYCCGISAACLNGGGNTYDNINSSSPIHFFCNKYKISPHDAWEIVNGFDGNSCYNIESKEFYDLGQKIWNNIMNDSDKKLLEELNK